MQQEKPPRLVAVVTGANSGVGYGICCRLIEQLSYFNPPDSAFLFPQTNGISSVISPFAGATELTLVVACRNPKFGRRTCELLSEYAQGMLRRRQEKREDVAHAEKFVKGLQIDYLPLDLGSIDSIFNFAVEAQRRYTYITHLMLNAGSLNMTRVDYFEALKQFIMHGLSAITTFPNFFVQGKSFVNKDGLNHIWQVNVFGHYCLYRKLESLLRANPFADTRIAWGSSLDGFKDTFDPNDIQVLRTDHPYQPSKFQVNLISAVLARSEEKSQVNEGEAKLTHVAVHPGICSTNNTAVLFAFVVFCKMLAFYIARWFGSINHPIQPFKGAVSNTFAALAPKKVLDEATWNPPRLLGVRTNFWGEIRIGLDPWEFDLDEAEKLKTYYENLYNEFTQTVRSPLTEDSGIALS